VTVTRYIPPVGREPAIASLGKLLASLLPDKALVVRVSKHKTARTDAQNRALWGVAYATLREQTGNDPADLHEYFCGEMWGWVDSEVFGMRKRKPARTTTTGFDGERDVLSTTDMADFYDFVQRRSAEAGFDVPDPGE